ncbi:MAG: hypothetical protein ACOX27_08515 [Caldicoprobacterales bacterium]|jgi:hypothetical protein|nr:hypothetical protein [Clostridiales bacterium]
MAREKKLKAKKASGNQNPAIHNDQLGENAAEHFSNNYDNKGNKKVKH